MDQIKEMLIELYCLKKIELHKLLKKFSAEQLLAQRSHFIVNELTKPVTVWRLFYYIDKHGDFINRGKLMHHQIARAIFNSCETKEQLQILEYIEDVSE